MPAPSSAAHTSTHPASCTFTDATSGRPAANPAQPATSSARRPGSPWIHAPVVTPISTPGTAARTTATAVATSGPANTSNPTRSLGCRCRLVTPSPTTATASSASWAGETGNAG